VLAERPVELFEFAVHFGAKIGYFALHPVEAAVQPSFQAVEGLIVEKRPSQNRNQWHSNDNYVVHADCSSSTTVVDRRSAVASHVYDSGSKEHGIDVVFAIETSAAGVQRRANRARVDE
jgi:hypothetical protein